MVNGTYNVSISTPMGMKSGKLILTEDSGELKGNLIALGKENPIMNGVVSGNNFEFAGILRTPFSRIQYTAKGTINGDILQATADTKFGIINISGNRV
jgi:hypothetical protein